MAEPELSLPEQRAPQTTEGTACLGVEPGVGPQAARALEADQAPARQWALDAVDRARVEATRLQRHLKRRGAGPRRSPGRPCERERKDGDADNTPSSHDVQFACPRRESFSTAATMSAASFPGSSIGRASGC